MIVKMGTDRSTLMDSQHIFRLLILYRWISLIPVFVAISTDHQLEFTWASTLFIALIANLVITMLPNQLNATLTKRPSLLFSDLILCGGLFFLTGGWGTPYYLYAISPLLAAAFFFGIQGALLTATGMSMIYLAIGFYDPPQVVSIVDLVVRIVGFFLISGTFGYASTLLKRLQKTHNSLRQAHRDLEVIHNLTLSLQMAVDVGQVQERVLISVTEELGFPHALVGLVNPDDTAITGWLGKSINGNGDFSSRTLHTAEVPLTFDAGIIPSAIMLGEPRLFVSNITTPDEKLNQLLQHGKFHVLPMLLRDHVVGVLLVGTLTVDDRERLDSLQSITSQAAVAIGTTMLCIDRARRLAVQDERIRFAREIHDTVSQSLFGLSYALDACKKLLPAHPVRVKEELGTITELAETTRQQVRQSIMDIWPTELTVEDFREDLQKYAKDFCRVEDMNFSVNIYGEFHRIPINARKDLYRIAQESITNIARHAAAKEAKICINVARDEVTMAVCDKGRGFNVDTALSRPTNHDRFGLRGIQERVEAQAGRVEFISQPGAGTIILVRMPTQGTLAHDSHQNLNRG